MNDSKSNLKLKEGSSTSTRIGGTKLFKGHSLLLPSKVSALYHEKPSNVVPILTTSASALSSRLRAFLPELAAANEVLAQRVLIEGPSAVNMNIQVSTPGEDNDDDDDDDDDEEEEEEIEEKDEDDVDNVDSKGSLLSETKSEPLIEMNISLHELLPGASLDNEDDNNNEIETHVVDDKTNNHRRVLIEEIESLDIVSRIRGRDNDEEEKDELNEDRKRRRHKESMCG